MNEFFIFLNHLPEPAIVTDAEQRILYANNKCESLLDYQTGKLEGIVLETILHNSLLETPNNSSSGSLNKFSLTSARGEDIHVEATSNDVEIEGQTLTLTLLHVATDKIIKESTLSSWGIGILEHNHITNQVRCSNLVYEYLELTLDHEFDIHTFANKFSSSEQELISQSILKAHDPDGDGRYNMTNKLVLSNGDIRWLHTRSQTQFGTINGKQVPVFTTGSIMDVTEQKELELKTITSEERLSHAIRISQVGIFEHDHLRSPDGSDLYWSSTLRNIFGIDENIKGDFGWFRSRIHPDDTELTTSKVMKSHDPNGNGEYDVEHRWHHPSGTVRWLSSRGKTTFQEINKKKVPIFTVGAILDITERKEVEEEQQRRTAILEATPDFVSMTDPMGNIVYLNKAGRTFLGIDKDADISSLHMGPIHTEEATKLLMEVGLPEVFKTGFWRAETEFIDHNGTPVPMSQVLLAHNNIDGEVAFLSTIARDLSGKKNLEEQFRQAQKMDAIGRLAGGIAHDFNNMLSVIMGFTELAADQIEKGHPAQDELSEVLRASDKAAALTERLLAFSRKQILQLIVLDVNHVLQSMKAIIERLVDESIQVKIIPSELPCRIKADPSQLEQILLNLSINAKDAMPDGGNLTIEVLTIDLDESQVTSRLDLAPGLYTEISVSDTGHGMDAETREKVFEPFFTTKASGRGTGLGLASTFGIVKQSGGNIWLYSEPGRGTVFKLYFPCTDEAETIIEQEPDSLSNQNLGSVVLITEDEPQLLSMVETSLQNAGYIVLAANSPIEALDIARSYEGEIHLLLTDVVMPKMSGKQLSDKLQKIRPLTNVLYMSGYTENSIVHHGVLDDGINFLPKPITPQKLLLSVDRVLSQSMAKKD